MSEKTQERRKEFFEKVEKIPAEKLVFLDEAGFNLAMTRSHARAPTNNRAYSLKPVQRGSNISMIGAVRLSGVCALYPYDGAVDGDRFLHYLKNHLLPTLNYGDTVIMDNLRVHHIEPVREALKKVGVELLYLPPYSPELNPIEEAWSMIKSVFKRTEARCVAAFIDTLQSAQKEVTKEKLSGWFKHAGYALS